MEKRNFVQNDVSRRSFLKKSALSVAGATILTSGLALAIDNVSGGRRRTYRTIYVRVYYSALGWTLDQSAADWTSSNSNPPGDKPVLKVDPNDKSIIKLNDNDATVDLYDEPMSYQTWTDGDCQASDPKTPDTMKDLGAQGGSYGKGPDNQDGGHPGQHYRYYTIQVQQQVETWKSP